jgi:hypothetical protein
MSVEVIGGNVGLYFSSFAPTNKVIKVLRTGMSI